MAEFTGKSDAGNRAAKYSGSDPELFGSGNYTGTFNERGERYRTTAQEYGALGPDDPGGRSDLGYAVAGEDFDPRAFQERVFAEETFRTGGATSTVDPRAYWLGGEEDFANRYATTREQYAAAANDRGGPQAGLTHYDAGLMGANMAALGQAGHLGQYGQDLDYMRAVAAGQAGPSAAQLAMERQADEAMRQNLAMAATGRGSAANTARMQALNQNALMQGQLVRDTQEARAQEQLNAMGIAMQGNRDMAGALDAYQGQYIDQAALGADVGFRQAGLDLDARTANDQMVQFFMAQGYNAIEAQHRANIEMDKVRTGNVLDERAMAFGNRRPSDPGIDWLGIGVDGLANVTTYGAYGVIDNAWEDDPIDRAGRAGSDSFRGGIHRESPY